MKYEAPYAWQNGTLNIVTPLSFDLREAQSIQNKAVKWFGLLYHLREAAEIQNLKFDLLVAQPTDARLTNAYEDALGIVQDISDLQHRLCVWHETEIDNYARYALNNAVTPLPVA